MATLKIDLAAGQLTSAQSAATWAERFYPGVDVTLGEQSITIQSEIFDCAQLERIWHAALLNEQLLDASCDQRRVALERLFQ